MSNSHVNIKGIKMFNKKVVAFLLKPRVKEGKKP